MHIKLNQLTEQKTGSRVRLLAKVQTLKEKGTTGKNYNQTFVTVLDRTGSTTFPVWSTREQIEQSYREGDLVEIDATISEYDGKPQLKPSSIVLLQDDPDLRQRIDPAASKTITKENEDFFHLVFEKAFSDQRYRRLCEIAYGLGDVPANISEEVYRARYARFKKAWASIRHHDSYEGGLFNHIVGLLRLWASVRKQYKDALGRVEAESTMNWDYVLAMIFLHDYAKQFDYITTRYTCEFNREKKLNHIYEGVIQFTLLHNELEPELKLTFAEQEEFKWGILCHHGKYSKAADEFRSERPEDKLFNALDTIDAVCVDTLIEL